MCALAGAEHVPVETDRVVGCGAWGCDGCVPYVDGGVLVSVVSVAPEVYPVLPVTAEDDRAFRVDGS